MAAVIGSTEPLGEPVTNPLSSHRVSQDESEFEYLFFEHYERVLRLLLRLTGNRAQAEEIANEVFWRLSRQPVSWLVSQHVAPWLYRTATNAGIDAIRASSKRAHYEATAAREISPGAQTDGPLEDLLRYESRRRVQNALSTMKPARAQLLLMRCCGCSYKELSEALNISVGSVGTLLNRAEEEFRKKYVALMAEENTK